MENIIDVKNISVKYGEFPVVNNISFQVNSGEFVSLIGPNGAGKSTVLKAIMKNVDLEGGEVLLCGKSIEKISNREKAQIIGFVPQEYNIAFEFSVYDIVAMGRNPYLKRFSNSSEKDDEIIKNALIKTNTFEFRDKSFNNLSGGEKQRVIIARALAQEPKVLILDEATSNLDIHHQLDILELIYALNRDSGLTVLAIMHDLNLAARFSNKIILLTKQGIVKIGEPKEVLNEQVLKNVYNMDMVVRENKLLSSVEVVPLSVRKIQSLKDLKIHVICGGGTGEYILQKLHSKGASVSCGVLSQGDSDLDVCKCLNLQCIVEKPFTEISSELCEKNLQLIEESDVVILTDVAIGPYNFDNLKILEGLQNKKIIILHNNSRDFIAGKADEIIEKLKNQENVFYAMNLNEMFEFLTKAIK